MHPELEYSAKHPPQKFQDSSAIVNSSSPRMIFPLMEKLKSSFSLASFSILEVERESKQSGNASPTTTEDSWMDDLLDGPMACFRWNSDTFPSKEAVMIPTSGFYYTLSPSDLRPGLFQIGFPTPRNNCNSKQQ
jgi:hypothetical protein